MSQIYAVFKSGGKQYRAQPGDIVQVEKLDGEVGKSVTFSEILFTSKPGAESSQISLGKPMLAGAQVSAEIVGQGRGEKIVIVKMKRRKGYRKTQGHRQELTQVLVTGISAGADQAKLSDADKKATLSKFYTNLKPKGPASTKKLLGSRLRRLQKAGVKIKK